MKFRLVDSIIRYCENTSISTRKAISFEEFSLLKRWGRKGEFPELLILQLAVESAAFLMAVSSQFEYIGLLKTIDYVKYKAQTAPGDILECQITTMPETNGSNSFKYLIKTGKQIISEGAFTLEPVKLEMFYDPKIYMMMLEEICVQTF
ncbi:MAG: hypothetical protein KKC46_21995 [Proteobacteria bacterium]|nr:hypothetical protein [Pseudomonadota bacterium]